METVSEPHSHSFILLFLSVLNEMQRSSPWCRWSCPQPGRCSSGPRSRWSRSLWTSPSSCLAPGWCWRSLHTWQELEREGKWTLVVVFTEAATSQRCVSWLDFSRAAGNVLREDADDVTFSQLERKSSCRRQNKWSGRTTTQFIFSISHSFLPTIIIIIIEYIIIQLTLMSSSDVSSKMFLFLKFLRGDVTSYTYNVFTAC